MANLNWERIGARYHLAAGDGAKDNALFLPYGSPAQEEERISAEELKAALESDLRPLLLDLCLPKGPAPTSRHARRCRHACSCRAPALDQGAPSESAHCSLLHLRISG